ncbi:MAG: hypothetical protein FJW40_04980 [Acidobacteria bacterium]|nr:hypothetical protein [Acidobacteriota bacterium]
MWFQAILAAHALLVGDERASDPRTEDPRTADTRPTRDGAPAEAPAAAEAKPPDRTTLNLLGKTDTSSGESRRNENVQFNLIDNNALKELNVRMGTTATIVTEFRAERGYFGTEFGNPPPGPIHVAVAKGVSALHGEATFGHGNSALSARSFFQVGGVKPAQDNQYGLQLAAPFWRGAQGSVDLSQQKLHGFVNGNVLVPLPNERTPLGPNVAGRRVIQRYLDAYPRELPNRTDIDPRALNTNARQAIDTDAASARIDQEAGAKNRIFARHALTNQQLDAFQLVAGQNPDTTTKSHTSRLTWVRILSAASNAEITAGYDRVRSLLMAEPNAVGPQVVVGTAFERLGPNSSVPLDRAQNRYRLSGLVRSQKRNHTLSAGGEVARLHFNGREASSNRGTLQFRNDFGRTAIENFLLAVPSRYSGGAGEIGRGFRGWEQHLYAGDTWRVRGGLTLTFGIRYQPFLGLREVNNLTLIDFAGDRDNVAPRFGLAQRLPGGWGVLRAAYGMHYGDIFPITLQQVRWNPPMFQKFEVILPDVADPLSGVELNPNARATVFRVPRDLRAPYTHQYSFSWEGELRRNVKFQLGYTGSRSHQLFMMLHENRATPVNGIRQETGTINLRRPDTRFFEVRRVTNMANAYFDAARVSLIAANWHGLAVDASYWFSKALDTGAAYSNTAAGDDARQGYSQSQFIVHADLKGPSVFDQSHAGLVRAAYAVPAAHGLAGRLFGRWSVSGVWLGKTGMPFTVISGSDSPGYGNVDGTQGDRPNLVDPGVLGRRVGHPDTSVALLPREAFANIGATDLRGNLGTGTFRRGGIANVNGAISRSWSVADKTLVFRVESINFFNTPQFAEPNLDLSSPAFGKITNTLNDGRTFRFQLRLSF